MFKTVSVQTSHIVFHVYFRAKRTIGKKGRASCVIRYPFASLEYSSQRSFLSSRNSIVRAR